VSPELPEVLAGPESAVESAWESAVESAWESVVESAWESVVESVPDPVSVPVLAPSWPLDEAGPVEFASVVSSVDSGESLAHPTRSRASESGEVKW
jgi:hypothetical protein